MKKKIVCLLLALALCVGACPVGAWANDVVTPTPTTPSPLPGSIRDVGSVKLTGPYIQSLSRAYNGTAVPVPDKTNVLLLVKAADSDTVTEYTVPEDYLCTVTPKWYRVENSSSGGAAQRTEIGYAPTNVDDYSLDITVSLSTKGGTSADGTSSAPAETITITNPTFSTDFKITKKPVTLQLRGNITKPYDGLATYAVSESNPSPINYGASGILDDDIKDVIILGDFHFDDSKVAKNKTFTAMAFELSGSKAGNYDIENKTATLTSNTAEITQMFLTNNSSDTVLIRNRQERTYTYALKGLLPSLPSTMMQYEEVEYEITSYTLNRPAFFAHEDPVAGKDIEITGTDKDQLTIKVKAASHTGPNPVGAVYFTVKSKNFQDFNATLSINSDDRTPVRITGLEATERTPYDGTEKPGYAGKAEFKLALSDGTLQDLPSDAKIDPATLDKVYRATNRSPSGEYGPTATPPTEPGEYTVTVSIPASNPDYAGSWTGTYTVTKAKVTVTALERRIKIDEPIPQFKDPQLGVDYSVQGLASGDKLKIPPTMKYATVADSIMEGEFEILIDGAMVPDNTHYDSAIEYKPGKLVVTSLTDKEENPFSDVSEYTWYVTAVKYVYNKGLMKGVTDTLFDPTGDLTRGMLVTILYRLDGEWPVWQTMPFTDLNPKAYYMDAVRWASANRIVNGYGDGRFGPDDVLTREQLAIILYNYARYSGNTPNKAASLDHFVDAYYTTSAGYRALQWTCAEGLIQGTGSTTISPTDPALRAQVAVIFMRYCTNILGK